jgi:hypothetical protein
MESGIQFLEKRYAHLQNISYAARAAEG